MGVTALTGQAAGVAFLTSGGRNRFFHRIYDGGDGDAFRRRQQPIAPPWPARRFHQPRAAEPSKKLFQIGRREMLGGGDIGDGGWSRLQRLPLSSLPPRHFGECHDGIATSG
jgi:hypothetical protein